MGLFVNKPLPSDNKYFYTLGQTKTVLVIGLGNVGKEFIHTRHNIGFDCLDFFHEKNSQMSKWIEKKDLRCHISSGQFGDTRAIAIKPTTYMNLSGESVELVSNFYKIRPEDILVIHDELDIDFGHIRTRSSGSSAGNNGVKSIINKIGGNFNRIRIGIRSKDSTKIPADKFVTTKFNKDENLNINELKNEIQSIIIEFIYSGKINQETRSFLS
ncbi:MAG TPA: aminoacyl-tRNA hydrolase [Candidatus Dormibacteraeota bacterium]|nr:aminoacyl-tRNA hydrolase [Candidatus Dormibacteraeota bacterium]